MNWEKSLDRIVIRFDKGDNLLENLERVIELVGIQNAKVSGIGSFLEAEIGFYQLNEKKYKKTKLSKTHEVVSLLGNISQDNKSPFIHLHTVLTDENFQAKGGHLFFAIVGATLEVIIEEFDDELERVMDDEIGLKLLDL